MEWQKNWDQLGQDDPLWVVLTDPTKKGGRWNPVEFFETGVREIADVLGEVSKLSVALKQGRALDFGCGVGRLSQALAAHFEEVQGVDISPSMIEHANRFNRFPRMCNYQVNSRDDLRLFKDNYFDFIYSNITLQHIEPRFSKRYIQEFVRVIKPGGVMVFQTLSPGFFRGLAPDALVAWYRQLKFKGQAFIGMFGVRDAEIARLLETAGARVLRLENRPNDSNRWRNRRYFVTKRS